MFWKSAADSFCCRTAKDSNLFSVIQDLSLMIHKIRSLFRIGNNDNTVEIYSDPIHESIREFLSQDIG